MAQYSKKRDNKLKPQRNDDIFEVNLLAHSDGEFVTTVNPWGKQVVIIDDDTVQHTSRNRRKVSTNEVLSFNTYQYDKDNEVWDESTSTGGTATYDEYEGGVIIEVTNTLNSEVIRQTKNVVRYVPGRQNELIFTTRFNSPTAGILRRVGVYDSNNGCFLEDNGGTYAVCVRRNTAGGVVDNRVTRDNWNYDKLDGTGPSGLILDFTKNQMFTIEYEWFGSGQVEFNVVIDNNKFPMHRFNTGNRENIVWSNTPFVPHRVEMKNTTGGTTGTHQMYQGGFAVLTEGTVGPLGRRRNVSYPITGKTLTTANIFYPVLTVRLQTSGLDGVALPFAFQAATLDNTSIFYRIVRDATLTGASYVTLADTLIEYDISATATSGGDIIDSGFISADGQGGEQPLGDPSSIIQIGRNNLGTTSQTLTIQIAAINSNKKGWAGLNWIEVR